MSSLVKICGIRKGRDVWAARSAGADYIGIMRASHSPRFVDAQQARELVALASAHMATVVVLEGLPDSAERRVLRRVRPDIIQVHRLDASSLCEARRVAGDLGVGLWWAINVSTVSDIERGLDAGDDVFPVFDAPALQGRAGGWGKVFDWTLFSGVDPEEARPFGLAGGLKPENVRSALLQTGASLADVSSGVERAPGIKDPHLIRRFTRLAKQEERGPDDLSDQ